MEDHTEPFQAGAKKGRFGDMEKGHADAAWSFAGCAGLSVSGGTVEQPPSCDVEERCHQGLKVVCLLEGALTCQLPGSRTYHISRPSLCAIMDQGSHLAAQHFDAQSRLRHLMITIDGAELDRLTGADLDPLAGGMGHRSSPAAPILMTRTPASGCTAWLFRC